MFFGVCVRACVCARVRVCVRARAFLLFIVIYIPWIQNLVRVTVGCGIRVEACEIVQYKV